MWCVRLPSHLPWVLMPLQGSWETHATVNEPVVFEMECGCVLPLPREPRGNGTRKRHHGQAL